MWGRRELAALAPAVPTPVELLGCQNLSRVRGLAQCLLKPPVSVKWVPWLEREGCGHLSTEGQDPSAWERPWRNVPVVSILTDLPQASGHRKLL